jgi:glycosyltransferase involved in cell wall biosynthesis
MFTKRRINGISVLLASQNEEATLELSIRSFLDFADEIIIVDNGSTDKSKEIALDLKSIFPTKIQFHDVPDLNDLYQNRQFAFRRSTYRWIVRADGDFIAYTDGEFNIENIRENLLRSRPSFLPKVYGAPLPNVTGDFWHTGIERPPGGLGPNDPGRYVPPPITHPTLRIYEVFPGFKFKRLGRWEATTFNRLLWWRRIELEKPLWMHCTLKTNRSFLYRSERTNWRELGDFKKYPNLDTYLHEVINTKYGTTDIEEAADIYMKENVYPYLQSYDPDKYYPYPKLILDQMAHNCIYRIIRDGTKLKREYYGLNNTLKL